MDDSASTHSSCTNYAPPVLAKRGNPSDEEDDGEKDQFADALEELFEKR